VPKTADEFTARFNAGDLTFALVDPPMLAQVRDAATLVASTTTEQDEVRRGLIVIPSESALQSVDELRGKSVCVATRSGLETFVSQMATLKSQGITGSELNFVVSADLSEATAINGLLGDECEAAFISESYMRSLDDNTLSSLKVLSYTARIPNSAVVAYWDTPQETIDKLKEALLKLTASSKELQPTGFSSFVEADQELYSKFLDAYSAE
ncbi:MAG TPA: hypothetical protein ENF73_01315, partial [Proteobacteria bacterium]|nr:hypothetical protein [Pseudomonadota bacterium]